MRKNKGITMISLVITIIVLLILTSITIYNGLAQLGIKRVNNLYADIDSISTKVAEYYLKNETIPIYNDPYVNNKDELKAMFIANGATETEELINVNDEGAYYVIDLSKLDNLTLNYGDDYKTWNSSEPKSQNVYIINPVTHQIYFPHGVRSGDEYYFARFPDENEISPIELEEINSDWTMNITNISGTNIGEDSISIVADVTLSGLTENYDLNSLEYAWAETNAESEIANITFTKFNLNSESEGNINATLASKVLSNTAEYYYLWVKVVDINGKTSYKYLTNSASPLTSNLPSNYQKVEYIESTGEQWIDTLYSPNQNTITELKYMVTNDKTGFLYGARQDYRKDTFSLVYYITEDSKNTRFDYNISQLGNSGADINTIYSVKKEKNKFYINNSFIGNLEYDDFLAPVNMTVFAVNTRGTIGTFISAKLYYLKIYNNEEKIRDFIPCYKKAENPEDNKPGLYDLVEGKFYINQGTKSDFVLPETNNTN